MVRSVIRLALVALVLVAGAFFLFGYWTSGSFRSAEPPAVETPSPTIDTAAARERGAEIGERAAKAVATAGASIDEGTLTAKIKAKMVLDDLVKARTIDVTTTGSTVTLSGTVHSRKEQERAVALARETEGVTQVLDRLAVQQP
jgi:hyperosmotically inducible protein